MKNTIKFIHVADTHLGYRQYNLKERFRDYNRAFKRLLEKAIDYEVDFIVHSGDMFHHSNINPETLTATLTMISQFKEESEQKLGRVIPILAIQGNHDQRGYRRLRSWMEVLAELELIVLLDAQYDKETNSFPFVPASVVNPKGGMIEIGNIRVFGIPAYGSISKDLLPYIYESLPPKDDHFNLLMMHFGIEGQVSNKFGLDVTNQDLNKLKEKVDYLALGHFHRQYSLPSENPWIFNPGSLEVVEMEEVYEQFNRGAFMIESKRDKSNSSKWRKKITPIICANGSAVDD